MISCHGQNAAACYSKYGQPSQSKCCSLPYQVWSAVMVKVPAACHTKYGQHKSCVLPYQVWSAFTVKVLQPVITSMVSTSATACHNKYGQHKCCGLPYQVWSAFTVKVLQPVITSKVSTSATACHTKYGQSITMITWSPVIQSGISSGFQLQSIDLWKYNVSYHGPLVKVQQCESHRMLDRTASLTHVAGHRFPLLHICYKIGGSCLETILPRVLPRSPPPCYTRN